MNSDLEFWMHTHC